MNLTTAVLSVSQMAEADRLTIGSGIPAFVLMETADRAVTQAIQQRWTTRPVLVLCGPGNNGGDGFVVARLLAEAGWPVRLGLLGSRERLKDAAEQHALLWPGPVEAITPEALVGVALIVDALFGAGLDRTLTGPALATLAIAAQRALPIVVIDVPSGVLGNTGDDLGGCSCTPDGDLLS